ncbi:Uncharacterized protein FWK35_00000431, partial [Aphis craccivora]
MEQKNDMLGVEDIVFLLLETLKSNGTFDEIRRHCVTDIDAKPTYQNWKQRIESNVHKFLSKVNYTPELNKNTVRERLRKHLFDGLISSPFVKYLLYIISSGVQVLSRAYIIYSHPLQECIIQCLVISLGRAPLLINVTKHETQDIEEGADRILTQVLAPRTLSMFEPKIAIAVYEYLGIKNEAPPIELNTEYVDMSAKAHIS